MEQLSALCVLLSPTPWRVAHNGVYSWEVFDAAGVRIMAFLDGPQNTANVHALVEAVNAVFSAQPADVAPSAQKQLEEIAQSFDLATKIKFPSCKFAAMSIHGPRRDWEVWGDFESAEQAQAAAQMWNAAFHQPIKSISTVNNAYRVVVAL